MKKVLPIALGVAVLYLIYDFFQGNGGGLSVAGVNIPSIPNVSPEAIQAFAFAISVAEGFGQPNAIPTLANNPGDITDVGQNLPGDTGQRMGQNIIVFDSVSDGWNALYAQAGRMLSGTDPLWPRTWTLIQTGAQYAGDPQNWPVNVADSLDVNTSTTLGQVAEIA